MSDASSIEDIAFAWAVRTADPDFRDWEAFLTWIDGDPTRNEAYNKAAVVVAEAAAYVSSETAAIAPVNTGGARFLAPASRKLLLAGTVLAIAASMAGVLLIGKSAEAPVWQVIKTPAGQTRSIALSDGSRIDLAGASQLQLDPARTRLARLERGRAVFIVRHDANNPFQVVAGAHRIVDAGTEFEVSREEDALRVEVMEGMVIVDPAAEALRLGPGQAAELVRGRPVTRKAVAPDSVGQWRRTSLSYTDAPLDRVAADLSVALGHSVAVDAGCRNRRITATIRPATIKGKPREAAELFGIRVVTSERGWTFYER